MKNQNIHLNEDQIICAIVDENDLAASERNHLFTCSLCQNEKQNLEQVLHRLGDMSKELVPSPRKKFTPAVQESHHLPNWWPVFATGAVTVLLIMGIWWTLPFIKLHENVPVQTSQKIESDQQWMAEIIYIDEFALPDNYLDLVSTFDGEDYEDEYDDYYIDEFLEYILAWSEDQKAV